MKELCTAHRIAFSADDSSYMLASSLTLMQGQSEIASYLGSSDQLQRKSVFERKGIDLLKYAKKRQTITSESESNEFLPFRNAPWSM